jgi:hypothetical protein
MGSGRLIVLDPPGSLSPGGTGVPAQHAADLSAYPVGRAITGLPNRDLTQAELAELAASVASSRSRGRTMSPSAARAGSMSRCTGTST